MAKQILVNDTQRLVVVESHLPRWALLVIFGICIAFPVIGVALLPSRGDPSDLPLKVAIGLGGVTILAGPFLVVLAASSYRRLEIVPGEAVFVHTVYRLVPAKVEKIPWADIRGLNCIKQPGGGDQEDRLRVMLTRGNGPVQQVFGGDWSDDLVAVIRDRWRESRPSSGE